MLEHNVLIAVCDAQRAHIYRNAGTAQSPTLAFVMGFEQKNPRSSEQGTDKPGTGFSRAFGQRSHLQETDYHGQRETEFARDILSALSNLQTEKRFEKLILVAPPRMLAQLRQDMPKALKAIIQAEIDKDLTKHPTQAIIDLVSSYRP